MKIHIWPDKILRKKCREVNAVDDEIRRLLEEMCVLMRENKGIGLAANQVGLYLKMAVIEIDGKIFNLINPRITKKEGEISLLEGCLSFPGIELNIKRAKKIWFSALTEQGDRFDCQADGLLAIVVQHEVDHLDGVCFIDRAPFWERIKFRVKRLVAFPKQIGQGGK